MTVRKTWTARKTFPFNLLVTGHTRAGKTDFIHTLLETVKIVKFTAISSDQSNGNEQALNYSPPPKLFPDEVTCPTALACAIECHPDPGSSDKISLGLIDSPGLSIPSGLNRAPQTSIDALEKHAALWATKIVEYCEKQYKERLEIESKIKRTKERDNQVHACLYLLYPDVVLANNGLSSMDIIALQILCGKVNVIPCIAKSDLVSVRELKKIKSNLLECFRQQALPIYQFMDENEDEHDAYRDEEEENADQQNEDDKDQTGGWQKDKVPIESPIPFCIVNSEELSPATDQNGREMGVFVNGEKILGRKFMWGVINVQNKKHCDLTLLKTSLFDLHIDDLKDCTNDYYEKWRTDYIEKNRRSMLFPADLTGLVQSLDRFDRTMRKDQSSKTRKSTYEFF